MKRKTVWCYCLQGRYQALVDFLVGLKMWDFTLFFHFPEDIFFCKCLSELFIQFLKDFGFLSPLFLFCNDVLSLLGHEALAAKMFGQIKPKLLPYVLSRL